jgi:carbon storage regulator
MLVLSRKMNETIEVPGINMVIRIVRISGDRVRIGIEAPAEILILRGELDENTLENVNMRSILEENVALREQVAELQAQVGKVA